MNSKEDLYSFKTSKFGALNSGNSANVPFLGCWKCDPFKVCWWPPTMWSKRSRIESPGASLQLGVKSIYPILTSGLICIKLMTETVTLMHFHKIFCDSCPPLFTWGCITFIFGQKMSKKKSIGIHHKPCYMLNFPATAFRIIPRPWGPPQPHHGY